MILEQKILSCTSLDSFAKLLQVYSFSLQLFAYVCTIAFAVDAFFKLKNYRERMANQQAATGQQQGNVEAGAHPAANAAAGATTY